MSDDTRSELNAIVTQRIEVAPGLIVMRVAPDGWELPRFEPGQYAVLGLPFSPPRCLGSDPEDDVVDPNKLIKRAYSIASSSVAREYFEFYISHCQDVWKNGLIDDLWGFRPSPETTHVFLCGNPGMIRDTIEMLAEEGFRDHTRKSPGQLHTEKYW